VATVRTIGKFLGEFLLHPTKTGAIAPSSQGLARRMVEWIDLPEAKTVLEYGPGTGVFTEHIIRQMPAGSKFAAIELNPRLAELFRRRHPDVTLVVDSVANVGNSGSGRWTALSADYPGLRSPNHCRFGSSTR
jgi:phosphatidylethanolamine/phosphatidyl-N-methylethanolamine N-methyltransferase